MDALLRTINDPETIRVIAAITTESAREACRRQGASHVSAAILARSMTVGVLLATLAKRERERVRIQINGGGPVGQIVIDAHGDGRVRACVAKVLPPSHLANRLLADTPRPSVAGAVGVRGHLVVTRDLGLARPYQGSVDLRSGEIDEDLEFYLDQSEQLPSALRTAVILDREGQIVHAVGVLAQGFPGSDRSAIDQIRERLADLRGLLANSVTEHAREPAPEPVREKGRELGELVGLALGGESFRTMVEHSVEFHCPCGPERARSVLTTLGPADLEALADEQDHSEVRCNFCGQVTTLSAAEVRALADELRRGQS